MPVEPLAERVDSALSVPVRSEIAAFAARLAKEANARAVLFYGSNLRSGSLEGVLDFYVLTWGPRERGLWPRVGYHEMETEGGETLRAKVAEMRLTTFAHAASGQHLDTTIWARFVQPATIAWAADDAARDAVASAIRAAAVTAGRFAAALGPERGAERDYWQALFRATYRAELRVEKPGREQQILNFGAEHFEGLIPAAWQAGGVAFARDGETLQPDLSEPERKRILTRWHRRRRAGKPLNVVRLLRAATTFEGGARYLAWKVERHTGVAVPLTPFQERHPLVSAPVLITNYLRARRRAAKGGR
ncbi:hypothetical protein [Croceicoccus naphthovorans]|uniref:Uncharacterized protein n=1 Tax=Croceicoccus naphthovorans TaxID=1348774 RepID=A0A0G3XFN0_9SPHN|nr:hypothetical protein [Croceicoccus naphthovorans]AKM09163.1 hypothetical protein AB433_02945 [Croceicoccus naphthovorans]MBB3990471.1 hypothetical protein [Croceicoccus naphthovorans]